MWIWPYPVPFHSFTNNIGWTDETVPDEISHPPITTMYVVCLGVVSHTKLMENSMPKYTAVRHSLDSGSVNYWKRSFVPAEARGKLLPELKRHRANWNSDTIKLCRTGLTRHDSEKRQVMLRIMRPLLYEESASRWNRNAEKIKECNQNPCSLGTSLHCLSRKASRFPLHWQNSGQL